MRSYAAAALLAVFLSCTARPASAGLLGALLFPWVGVNVGIQTVSVDTVVQPVAVGVFPCVVSVIPGGSYLAKYPPASDCVARALNLTKGCSGFLQAVDNAGGSLNLFSIKSVLELAKTNKSEDVSCYNKVATFFNGGCLCDPTVISLVQTFNTTPPIPDFAKQALVSLNQQKCPPQYQYHPPPGSSPPPSSSPSSPSKNATVIVQKPQPATTVIVGGRRRLARATKTFNLYRAGSENPDKGFVRDAWQAAVAVV